MEFELETIHLTTLAFTAMIILYSDHQGLQYFRGKTQTLSPSFVVWSHRLVWVGLIGMIISGFFLVMPAWEHWVSDPVFYVKMGFVIMLVINACAIGKLSPLTTKHAFHELPSGMQKVLLVSGTLSVMGWISATVIGFLFL